MKQVRVPTPRRLPSGNWFIQLRLKGQSIPITAPTERECIRQAVAYKSGLKEAEKEKARPAGTLREAIDRYIDARENVLSPSTIRGYRTVQRSRFQAYMDTPLSRMGKDEWQRACNVEAKMCSAKTLKNAWGFISSVIAEITGERYAVRLPQIVAHERAYLDPAQIETFVKAIKGQPVEIAALLALSSLRRSEICALRWEDVDLEKGVLHVHGAAVPDEKNQFVQKGTTKNPASRRTVPIMMQQLRDALGAAERAGEYVVNTHPQTICNGVNRACERCGLPPVGTHGLRHSFASLAYHLGVPELVAMEIGGWSDIQTMRRIYTHIARADVEHYGDRLAGFFDGNANGNANGILGSIEK